MRYSFLFTAWLLWMLAHASRMIIGPVLPLVEDDLGITHEQAGRIFLFLSVGYTISLLSAPFWSRLLGYRRALQIGLIALLGSLVLMRWVPNLLTVCALTFCIGLTTGTVLPSAIPLITAAYGKEQWGKSIGLFDSAAPAGQFVAPLIAVLVLSFFSWRYVFWGMAVIGGVTLLLFLATAPKKEPETDRAGGSIVAVFRNRSLMTLGGLWVLASGSALGAGFLFPVYLVKERGMDLSSANQYFALGRGLAIVTAVYAGFLADRFQCRNLLGWILALSGASLVGVALWPDNVGVGVFVVIEGLVVNMFFPVGLIMIARLTAAGVRGAATGLVIGVGAAFGFGLTPWALGAVADAWSFQGGIAVLGVVAMTACLLVLRLDRV